MAKRCEVSGRGRQVGNNVSHANNKRKKIWQLNLQHKRLFDPETGKWTRIKVSSRALRTIDKQGLNEALS